MGESMSLLNMRCTLGLSAVDWSGTEDLESNFDEVGLAC